MNEVDSLVFAWFCWTVLTTLVYSLLIDLLRKPLFQVWVYSKLANAECLRIREKWKD
jgi:hypothetical protein